MTVSEKQLIANRQNCQKSTGPKTDRGKETVANNAVKHGVYSSNIIIDSPHLKEDPSEYDYLLNSLIEELNPTTNFQECLVRKIANCFWRSRRIINAETARINRQLGWVNDDLKYEFSRDPQPDELETVEEARTRMEINSRRRANVIGVKSIPDENFSVRILRYEMRLDRQMTRTYQLLRKLQSKDRDEETDSLEQK